MTEVGEDFHEGFALHSSDGARGEADFSFAVLVEHALLEKLLEELRLLLVLGVFEHLLDGFEGLLAVLEDELHHLVQAEELIGGGEALAVEFAVEVLHAARLYAEACGGERNNRSAEADPTTTKT